MCRFHSVTVLQPGAQRPTERELQARMSKAKRLIKLRYGLYGVGDHYNTSRAQLLRSLVVCMGVGQQDYHTATLQCP